VGLQHLAAGAARLGVGGVGRVEEVGVEGGRGRGGQLGVARLVGGLVQQACRGAWARVTMPILDT
jgi:hypothetical protein